MRRNSYGAAIILGTTLLAGGAMSLGGAKTVAAQGSAPLVIEMTAKKYEFSPTPHVKMGQKTELKVTAEDHDHGLAIDVTPDGAAQGSAPGLVFDSPQRCWKVTKGGSVTIDFVPSIAGTYTIKCCVDCGMGHRHMRGQIIVE